MPGVAVRAQREETGSQVAELLESLVRLCHEEIQGSRELKLLHRTETHDRPDLCPVDQVKPLQALVETKDDMTSTQSRTGREPRDSTSPTAITAQLRGEAEEANSTEKNTRVTIVPVVTDLEAKEVTPTKTGPKGKEMDGTILAVGLARKARIEDRKKEVTTEAGTTTDDLMTRWTMSGAKEATTEAGMTTEDIVLDRTWREAC